MPEMKFCPWCGNDLEPKDIDGEPRIACSAPDCEYVFWNNPVPVVASIVEMDGNVILIQNKGWPDTWYALVSGFVEKGESPEEAAARELKEELDLDAENVNLVGLYPFVQKNELIIAYHIRASGQITMGDELTDYKQVPTEKLKPWAFGTGPAVADWLEMRKG